MYFNKWMNEKVVIQPDWPFSLGWRIGFVTCNKNFGIKSHMMKQSKLNKAVSKSNKNDATHGYSALASSWGKQRFALITVFYKGDSIIRFIELVTHEASHIVDGILERVQIEVVDTEVRAYLLDWIVGKILQHTKLKKTDKDKYLKITKLKKQGK